MEKIVIEINCIGPSFHNPRGEYDPIHGTALILMHYMTKQLLYGDINSALFDSSGNRIGIARIETEA
jgi:hypothetical protein